MLTLDKVFKTDYDLMNLIYKFMDDLKSFIYLIIVLAVVVVVINWLGGMGGGWENAPPDSGWY